MSGSAQMHIHAVLRRWVSGGRAVLASLVTFLAARVRASRRRLGGFVAAATLATRHRQLVRYAPLLLAPVLAAAAVIPLMPGTPRQARPAGPPLGNLVQPPGLTRHAQQTTRGPVTLATGDVARLIPAPGGRSMVSVTPPRLTRNTAIHPFADTFKIGGDVYAVPGDALPYFGSVLDPRLFDVSYLQRAGYAALKTLPVSISWRHPEHSEIPGLASPTAGRRTTGSISMSTASAFGQALARSHGPGHGVLSQVNKISLGPLPAGQAQQPPAGAPWTLACLCRWAASRYRPRR